jgi:Type IV pili methyl-accepting chemotaxis transducer N-term
MATELAAGFGGAWHADRLQYGAGMRRSWSLSAKLGAIVSALLLMAFASIGLTLWVTWQLEGGAAAGNEAGRRRMETWRTALTLARGDAQQIAERVAQFEESVGDVQELPVRSRTRTNNEDIAPALKLWGCASCESVRRTSAPRWRWPRWRCVGAVGVSAKDGLLDMLSVRRPIWPKSLAAPAPPAKRRPVLRTVMGLLVEAGGKRSEAPTSARAGPHARCAAARPA